MKKLIASLGAISLVASSAASVVACGGLTEETNVIFMLESNVASSTGKIAKAYSALVDSFNAQNTASVEIEFKTAAANKVASDIVSKNNLPDFYVAYPDSVTKYVEQASDKVRNFDDITIDGLINDSFKQEGTFGDHQYLLPYAKSTDVSVVNLRLVKEVLAKFGITATLTKNDSATEITASGLFTDITLTEDANYIEIKALLDASFNEITSNEDLREVLLVSANTFSLSRAYNFLYQNNRVTGNGLVDSDYFALSYDSTPNKVYSEYASILGTAGMTNNQIKVSGKSDTDQKFMYSFNKDTSGTPSLDVFLKEDSQQTQGLENIFSNMEAYRTINGTSSSKVGDWYGKLYIQRLINGKSVYGSDFFKKGSVMISSGSTAGLSFYANPNNKVEELKIESNDLLITATATANGGEYYAQQGPSIASFTSSNENKQAVADSFIEFIYKPEVLAAFGAASGYVPVTTSAIEHKTFQNAIKTDTGLTQVVDIFKNRPEALFTVEATPIGSQARQDIIQDIIQNYMYESGQAINLATFVGGVGGKNGAKAKWTTVATDYSKNLTPNFK